MTNGPVPTPAPRNEGEYARKLALAILSTLEQKGLLTRFDVDTILQAAHRAAQASAAPTPPTMPQGPMVRPEISVRPPAAGPADLNTRWVRREALEEQAPQATQGAAKNDGPAQHAGPAPEPQGTGPEKETGPLSGRTLIIPSPESEGQPQAEGPTPTPDPAPSTAVRTEGRPPVIDFTLD